MKFDNFKFVIHTNLTRRFWSIIIIDHPQVIPFMRFCACPEILGCVDCARPGFHKKSKRQLDGILDGIQTARTSFSERPWVLSSFLYLFEVSKCVWCYVLSFSLFYFFSNSQRSFAFDTVSRRMPVILTRVIDTLSKLASKLTEENKHVSIVDNYK